MLASCPLYYYVSRVLQVFFIVQINDPLKSEIQRSDDEKEPAEVIKPSGVTVEIVQNRDFK
ncbi:hypothetical protein CHS0354_019405 [Potamilus streckersoni]|uniref:Uncharacterized protein n=1 Tax=Potamilus streckersoni TaxID=2493646 RepID=A0AAE0VW27_9BIVA|nr:hypothetical protein CHS0354_019405 [Potamilus streckersoni]